VGGEPSFLRYLAALLPPGAAGMAVAAINRAGCGGITQAFSKIMIYITNVNELYVTVFMSVIVFS
jgi:hypothetical protein